mmetsp:Transcript_20808/g.42018  ORF Transcript_20808/g.42018 Transcript_20808/m.42018 type:complete len:109 (-) Transcript_20808:187-513(-)|eukprot:CAMPEP_0183298826 /NCGR_PEP_ID=MMETSP0160_2-20130417/5731_1 /TAXON_ID=2839 ORGANISM="Odontella Sinensis, Strain Grunow 1884" /NCGR_SAMPLE_ID=MMETSP0160_2 /ASSEMBLY_ACC=CAM_ASM_000250 /LENGTH=108 /DNA_ID=CAMNT_0025460943 /DNA_START=68 /DNA_END=394 /DNA_ORIENTATION=-
MVYVNADGTVGDGGRPRTRNPLKLLTGFLSSLLELVTLFFRAVTNPPDRLTNGRRRTTYAERQGVRRPNPSGGRGLGGGDGDSGGRRRANIRGVNKLGDPKAICGTGG